MHKFQATGSDCWNWNGPAKSSRVSSILFILNASWPFLHDSYKTSAWLWIACANSATSSELISEEFGTDTFGFWFLRPELLRDDDDDDDDGDGGGEKVWGNDNIKKGVYL